MFFFVHQVPVRFDSFFLQGKKTECLKHQTFETNVGCSWNLGMMFVLFWLYLNWTFFLLELRKMPGNHQSFIGIKRLLVAWSIGGPMICKIATWYVVSQAVAEGWWKTKCTPIIYLIGHVSTKLCKQVSKAGFWKMGNEWVPSTSYTDVPDRPLV